MVYFGTEDGQIIGKLGEVTELELTCEDTEPLKFDNSAIEIPVEFDKDLLLRTILPQGEYNAYVLKRDGYLNPKNGWFTPEKVDEFLKEMYEENLIQS